MSEDQTTGRARGAARRALPVTAARTTAPGAAGERRPLLSLIVPAYNEEGRIVASLTAMGRYLADAGIDYELIAVDDGSTDRTAELLGGLGARQPRLRVVSYALNRGKGYAVRAGVMRARGRYVMFIDADLSIPIAITAEFLRALREGYDIAIASRWHPASSCEAPPPPLRRLMGRVFRWCAQRVVPSAVRDTQCGGKIYRAEVARDLFARQRIDHFCFDAEVLFLAARAGCRITEVPCAFRHTPGSSVRPVRDALLMLRDLARIRLYAARGRYGDAARAEGDGLGAPPGPPPRRA